MAIINGISSAISTDPTSQSGQSAQSLEEDLNRFLTLLTTQLQYQDPLDPMDATEFTSQLVQFASVEQQIYQNSNLEKLLNLEETSQLASMVDFIDRVVEVEGQGLVMENSAAKFTYNIPSGTSNSKITISYASGLQVLTLDGETELGVHSYEWDGKGNGGQQLPDGLYHVQVTAFDAKDNILDVLHTTFGRVTGAGVINGDTTLFMGPLRSSLQDILSVEEAPQVAEETP